MTNVAYLILAFRGPRHVRNLVDALRSDTSGIFIHLDRKTDIEPYRELAGERVTLLEDRVAVHWAEVSQVTATLLMIRAALADPAGYERIVLLSGTDYPLLEAAELEQYFAERPRTEFMNLVSMPNERAKKPLSRLTDYWVEPSAPRAVRLWSRSLLKLGLTPGSWDYREAFGTLQPYAGSALWALTREACEHIIAFTDERPELLKFLRHAWAADEAYWHTIIGNSPFAPAVVRNLTYADWSAELASPRFLTDEDYLKLREHPYFPADDVYGPGDILFARKFTDENFPDAPVA